jgi:branched-chain amino acid transport system permease protein
MQLLAEQILNGLQLSLTLFLLAAGLTLVFGIMDVINLAHGSLYMLGAYAGALVAAWTGSFWLAVLVALITSGLVGLVMEVLVIRSLYKRDHLAQVLATFGLILFFNGLIVFSVGRAPVLMDIPAAMNGFADFGGDLRYPVYRLAVMAAGILVALALWFVISRTRIGMLIRAGSDKPEMVSALGVDISKLFTLVFAAGALLAGLAGVLVGPIRSVQVGMGEQILITTFVVIVVGGIGSIRGAFIGSLLIGLCVTLGRSYAPMLLKIWLSGPIADGLGATLSSVIVYLVMALILIVRPRGLFPVGG